MANLYRIEYDNADGSLIRCDILEPGTLERSATLIEIQGEIEVSYNEIDDPLEPIQTSVATIYLEADLTNTFDELYSETERSWIVLVYRDDELVFRGWLSPDGIYEDYVTDAWIITLEARDPLADLENKAYTDPDGNLYEGKDSLRSIVLKCLARTGFTQYTLFQHRSATTTSFPVSMVTTFPSIADFFDQQLDQRIFLSSDGKTALSCAEVLKTILSSCNSHVYSWAGNWYICWSLQVANPTVAGAYGFNRYEIDGTPAGTVSEAANVQIGSEILGFPIHWAGENQRIERRPSVGACKISYTYGKLGAINPNPNLDNNGSSITGWTVNSPANVTLNTDGTVTIQFFSPGNSPAITSDETLQVIQEGNRVTIQITGVATQPRPYLYIATRVTLDQGGTPYYLGNEGQWSTTYDLLYFYVSGMPGNFTFEFTSEPVPVEATVNIAIFIPVNFASYQSQVTLDTVSIGQQVATPADREDHIIERVAAPSSFIQPTITVTVGDYTGTDYLGSYYRSDGSTRTTEGYTTPTSAFAFPLYQKMTQDIAFFRGKVVRVFEGDAWGWIPYNARVIVNNFPNAWKVAGWTWRSKANTFALKLWEVPWDTAILDDTDYQKVINYGQVVEPTIKG